MKPDKKNMEGYADPTAYGGMMAATSGERAAKKRADNLIGTIKLLADLAGFDIIGRIYLRHRDTGCDFR